MIICDYIIIYDYIIIRFASSTSLSDFISLLFFLLVFLVCFCFCVFFSFCFFLEIYFFHLIFLQFALFFRPCLPPWPMKSWFQTFLKPSLPVGIQSTNWSARISVIREDRLRQFAGTSSGSSRAKT